MAISSDYEPSGMAFCWEVAISNDQFITVAHFHQGTPVVKSVEVTLGAHMSSGEMLGIPFSIVEFSFVHVGRSLP